MNIIRRCINFFDSNSLKLQTNVAKGKIVIYCFVYVSIYIGTVGAMITEWVSKKIKSLSPSNPVIINTHHIQKPKDPNKPQVFSEST